MRWVISEDGGSTVSEVTSRLRPRKNADGDTVHIHAETEPELLAEVGVFPLTETPKPPDTETQTFAETIVRGPDGFVTEWAHDQARHASRLEAEAAEAKRTELAAWVNASRSATITPAQMSDRIVTLEQTVAELINQTIGNP